MPLRFSTLYRKTNIPVEISLILGWGEGIFARPRFSAAAEFRASETGAPPNYNQTTLMFIFFINFKLPKFCLSLPE